MLKELMLDVLEETLEYYQYHPERRAVEAGGACQYFIPSTPAPRMCAVGRCLVNPEKLQSMLEDIDETAWLTVSKLFNVSGVFKDKYKPLTHYKFFWSDLQKLHDWSRHWKDGVLTSKGENWYRVVKERIHSGDYKEY